MTTQTAITPAPATALAEHETEYAKRYKEMARRIKYMIVNGNKLQDQEVYALATYATTNDLNPFAGECYYLPGAGPVPGIAGWRKKAQEQLDFEAARQNTQAHFWIEVREATQDEAPHKDGDIAVHVTLHDWLSNRRWRTSLFETLRELKDLGFPHSDALRTAKDMVGPEPVWTGIGTVYAAEKFGKDGQPEKWSRRERAEKRAEKVALRKRFPRVNLPEPSGQVVDADAIDVQYSEQEQQAELPEGKKADTNQILAELGFAPEPARAKTTYTREDAAAELQQADLVTSSVTPEQEDNQDYTDDFENSESLTGQNAAFLDACNSTLKGKILRDYTTDELKRAKTAFQVQDAEKGLSGEQIAMLNKISLLIAHRESE